MSDRKRPERIMFAVDPFDRPSAVQKKCVRFLKEYGKGRKIRIEPVCVLSPDHLRVNPEFSPAWARVYRPSAERALRSLARGFGLKGLLPSRVLVQEDYSVTQSVKTLVAHARRTGADAIVVGTHGRKGFSRFVLGSFAETLLLYSDVPIFLISPDARIPSGKPHLLFATDLSPASRRAFDRVVNLAVKLGARISLANASHYPIDPLIQGGALLAGGAWTRATSLMTEDEAHRRSVACAWADRATAAGVEAEAIVAPAPDGVVRFLLGLVRRSRPTLLAMAAQSGPARAVLMGSITRQLARTSPVPMWILHS